MRRLLLTLMFFGLTTTAANADFIACNETDNNIALALGLVEPNGASSQGWWIIEPTKCETIAKNIAEDTRLFAYATHHIIGGTWSGNHTFCVGVGAFEATGRDNCRSRGLKPVGFFEIDTKISEDLRYTFTEEMNKVPAAN